MLVISQLISNLTILVRRQAEASSFAEHQTAALHKLSRQKWQQRGVDKLLETGVTYIGKLFECEVLALFPDHPNLEIRARYGNGTVLNAKELGLAQWVYDLGQTAGLGTDTLPFSEALYIPLSTSQGTIGVLRIRPRMKISFWFQKK